MWKDSGLVARLALFLVIAIWRQGTGLTFVGFEPIGHSDTIDVYDVTIANRWIDASPGLIFRSGGYPDPTEKQMGLGRDYLYSCKLVSSRIESQFVLADSFDTGSIIAGDFDSDGNPEVLGNQEFYTGDGTEITIVEYTGGIWKEYREAIPFGIDAHFAADLFDDQGDDFIFAFGIDTLGCDTCSFDIETSPPMGLIYGNRDGGKLNLHVDSTFHYALQSLDVAYGETTYVYIYEAVKDTASFAGGGPLFIGSLVKYRFDRETARLERLYYAECPYFGGGFTHYNGSSVYARDSLIVILDNSAMQWFIDDGQSLTLSLMQWTPFPCFAPVLFDIDGDGEDEFICTEPQAPDGTTQGPNWVIKAYKLLE